MPRQPHEEWDWDPYGFPHPCWTHLLQSFPHVSRQITVALPCMGLDACSHSLAELGIPFHVEYGFDTHMGLLGPITDLHGPDATGIHLGHCGDILAADISRWHRVDGVVSGPPCPPWSTIGLQHGWSDVRAQVFMKVTDVIVDQGYKGAYFFLLEMVEGMAKQQASAKHDLAQDAQPESPHTAWVADLGVRAPMWEIHVWKMNTQSYLPQHRPRLYTVGVNKAMGCHRPKPPLPPPLALRPCLDNIMHPGIPAIQEDTLSAQHRSNLQAAKITIQKKVSATHGDHCQEVWAAVALDRNPDRTWGVAIRTDGTVATLRTAHSWQWILHWRHGVLRVSRRLHPIEHLTLQGFPPELARSMSRSEVVRGAGNACSVPVMGAALASLLQACPELVHSDSNPSVHLGQLSEDRPRMRKPSVHGGQLSEDRHRKQKRVEGLRTDITMFQAKCKLLGR